MSAINGALFFLPNAKIPEAVQAVSNLAKSANGARVGFELTK